MGTHRPYVLALRGNSARGTKDAPERMTCADARVLAGIYRIDPVSRIVPRSSRSSPLGPWVELRYVDPRPDAPMLIRPQFQKETSP